MNLTYISPLQQPKKRLIMISYEINLIQFDLNIIPTAAKKYCFCNISLFKFTILLTNQNSNSSLTVRICLIRCFCQTSCRRLRHAIDDQLEIDYSVGTSWHCLIVSSEHIGQLSGTLNMLFPNSVITRQRR